MTIEELIEYIMHTPENINYSILKQKLEELQSGGGNLDFSIAEIAIKNETAGELDVTLPCFDVLEEEEEEFLFLDSKTIMDGGMVTFFVPLYQGTAILEFIDVFGKIYDADISTPPELILNGNLQFREDSITSILVSGDGSIIVRTEQEDEPVVG